MSNDHRCHRGRRARQRFDVDEALLAEQRHNHLRVERRAAKHGAAQTRKCSRHSFGRSPDGGEEEPAADTQRAVNSRYNSGERSLGNEGAWYPSQVESFFVAQVLSRLLSQLDAFLETCGSYVLSGHT